MPHWSSRRGDVRTVGLIAAAGITVAFGTVIAWYSMKPPGPRSALPTAPPLPHPIAPPALPEVKATTGDAGLGKVNRLGAGTGFFFTIVDKLDPTKVVGEINAKRSEPLENKRYKLEEPRAWMLMRQNRWAHIQAARGRAFMPDEGANARPQQALLEGDVVIKLFATRPDGSRPTESDTPILIARTPTLEYDGTLGQIIFPDRIELDSSQITFKGSGVSILINEADQRLEAMTIERTEQLDINPKASPVLGTANVTPAPPALPVSPLLGVMVATPLPQSPAPAAPATPPAAPVESLYAIQAIDNVSVEQSGRRVWADRVEGWLRLVDNQLRQTNASETAPPAGAASPAGSAGATTLGVPNSAAPASPSTTMAGPTSAATTAPTPAPDETIRLRWTGRATVRPLASATPELSRDDMVVRFLSSKESGVRVIDPSATITGNLVEYAATTRRAAVGADGANRVRIESGTTGLAIGKRFDIDLANGKVTSTGPGELTSRSKPDPAKPNVPTRSSGLAWTDLATFTFALEQGKMTSNLLRAVVSGQVRATDGTGVLQGDSMLAEFVPSALGGPAETIAATPANSPANSTPNSALATSKSKSWIRTLDINGNVRADDGKAEDQRGTLQANALTVTFADAPINDNDQPDITRLVAKGGVTAGRQETQLSADRLEATLARNAENPAAAATVNRLIATDAVTFRNRDGVTATADALEADPIAQTAVLTGQQPQLRKGDDATGLTVITSLSGSGSIRLSDADRSLTIVGPGSFSHTQPSKDTTALHAVANWSDGLTYSDLTGTAICTGQANIEIATTTPGSSTPTGKDTAKGDEIRLMITPSSRDASPLAIAAAGPSTTPSDAAPDPNAAPTNSIIPNDRRFLRAEAISTSKPSSFEFRRYAANALTAEPTLERLLYLESANIVADNTTGLIQTPGPGKLITLDRTAEATSASAGAIADAPTDAAKASLASNTSVRGSSLFTWKGSMQVDRPTGTATLTGGARMVHDPLPPASNAPNAAPPERTELECADLTARFRELASASTAPSTASSTAATTPADGNPPAESVRGELQSVHAQSSVWMRVGPRELVADVLDYDAATRRAEAQALGETPVTLVDRTTGSPVSAKRLLWDLTNNRIEILKPVVPLLPR